MSPIGCRDEYRKGWLEAVEGLHTRIREAMGDGDAAGVEGDIFQEFYDFHDEVLRPWTVDARQPNTPPKMDP